MAGGAIAAGAAYGMFTAFVSNRTQWEYLRAQSQELAKQIQQVRTIGATEIRMFARTAVYRMGAIEAQWGHSGIAADSGSAFENLMAQAGVNALTKLNIKRNTDLQVRNLQVGIDFMDYQRKILDKQLPLQMINSGLSGASGGVSAGSMFPTANPAATQASTTASNSFGNSFVGMGE